MRVSGFWLAVMLAGVVLAGCSAEPTEADLTRTLRKELAEVDALARAMLGEEAAAQTAVDLVSLDKIGCSAGDAPNRFLCEAEVVVDSAEVGRKTLRAQLHMLNEKQGWTIVKQLPETPDHQ